MIAKQRISRTAIKALVISAMLSQYPFERAEAKMPKLNAKDLVQTTEYVLQKQDVRRTMAEEATAQGKKAGALPKESRGFEIEPVQILPWRIEEGRAVSVVRVKATGGQQEQQYTFAVVFRDEGFRTLLLYPGTSNADPALFSDLLPPARMKAQIQLKSEEVTIKDTKVIGAINPSGWNEEWLWVDEKGKTYAMEIKFVSAPTDGGTTWSIKGN